MQLNYKETAEYIKSSDNIFILTHQSPDGDTFGCAFALLTVLRKMGKKANVLCSDEFPKRYDFMYENYQPQEFEHKTIIAVDVADKKLLGKNLSQFGDCVDLCIDHHSSNMLYAERLLLNGKAAAACEVMYELFVEMGVDIDQHTAECLYTGIATDTGCFKFDNTTSRTHCVAAELMKYNIRYWWINRRMFDIKSKSRIKIEAYVTSSLEYYYNDKCSLIAITGDVIKKVGVEPEEFEGLASLAMQLESVEVGITMKEREPGVYKVSMRSSGDTDVCEICSTLEGGGHKKAAGCLVRGTLQEAKDKLLQAVAKSFGDSI